MSIVVPDVFADRIEQYLKQNPDASAPEVLGRFLIEPTDEQRAFVEAVLADADGGMCPGSVTPRIAQRWKRERP